MPTPAATLSLRELNRASLHRQLLLARTGLPVEEAVDRVGGLQAQYSPSPYVALWSRVVGFERDQLTQAMHERRVVKATAMRATLYLMGTTYLQAAMSMTAAGRIATWTPEARRRGYDDAALRRLHARFLAAADEQSRTQDEMKALADELLPPDPGQRYPSWRIMDAQGGLVHVPPSGTWRYHGPGTYRSARSWVPGWAPPPADVGQAEVARRFLAAFGPASIEDFQKFSGDQRVSRTRAAFAALGPLVRYRDEAGRTLLDLPDASIPDPDTTAPVRFLPKYESLVVAYAARDRILPPAVAPAILHTKSADILASFLVDGFAAGTWTSARNGHVARLDLLQARSLSGAERRELEDEGDRLIRWLEPDATTVEIRIAR